MRGIYQQLTIKTTSLINHFLAMYTNHFLMGPTWVRFKLSSLEVWDRSLMTRLVSGRSVLVLVL